MLCAVLVATPGPELPASCQSWATWEDTLCCDSPALLTTEASPAGAHIAAGHVFAGATIDTRVRLTLIVVDVTVCPTPPGVTVTLVPGKVTTLQVSMA
jgi:hypothetical protein